MKYSKIRTGKFIERPNRFIALVEIDGRTERCHVKNTGRCKEIFLPGTTVVLEEPDNPNRKTPFDVIAAYKGDRLINIDSQAPNKTFLEFLPSSGIISDIEEIRPEYTHGDSRFDVFVKYAKGEAFIEIKGVTLEKDGLTLFPDAPTERGLKHVRELMQCVDEGYDAYIVFVVQMKDVNGFTPNYEMHKEFGDAVKEASEKGVHVLAFDCDVTEDGMTIKDPVKIVL